MPAGQNTASLQESPLETTGPQVLSSLREHSRAAIEHLKPEMPSRPADLSNMLGLDRALGWRIWQIAFGDEAYPVSSYIPGRHAMNRFLRAAASHGVPDAKIRALESAHHDYDELAVIHASDRTSFDIMLDGITKQTHPAMALELRRDAFRGNTHFLGVLAKCNYMVASVWKDDESGELVRTVLRGLNGITRMRPDQPFVLGRSAMSSSDGQQSGRKPIASATPTASGLPILADFTTADADALERRRVEERGFEDVLLPGPVGANAAVDVVFGEEYRSPLDSALADGDWSIVSVVRQPVESYILEVFIDAEVFAPDDQTLHYWSLNNRTGHLARSYPEDFDRIPLFESITRFDSVKKAKPAPDITRHEEVREVLFSSIGVPTDRLIPIRIEIRYPPCPSETRVVMGLKQ